MTMIDLVYTYRTNIKREMNETSIFNKSTTKLCYILFILNFLYVRVNSHTFEQLAKITTLDMIKNEGYPGEEHQVVTEDGYILTVYRIPGGPLSTPVLVQHGILSSSFDWVVTGKNKSLSFVLADKGYDVWLGNARGNTYSRRHISLLPSNPDFWDFSIHEMGVYDLPAVITYITDLKNASLIYIGHSMGTAISYIMATERPDMTNRVKVIFSFAPIAFMRKWASPSRLVTSYIYELEILAKRLNIHEVFASNANTRLLLENVCQELSENNPCVQLLFYIAGYNPSQFNYTLLPMLLSHSSAGTSAKTVIHLGQIGKTGRFRNYDYGPIRNKIVYNSLEPPEYDLSKIQIPNGILWSDNDLFCHPSDAQAFYEAVPKKVLNYRIPSPSFSHVDFMWGIDASSLVYSKLLSAMEEYITPH